jgi:hypothetical protein
LNGRAAYQFNWLPHAGHQQLLPNRSGLDIEGFLIHVSDSALAAWGECGEMAHEAGSEAKRWLLHHIVGDLRNDENREPITWEGADELQGWTEDGLIAPMQEQGLPDVNAVREDSDMHDGAGVEHAANDRGRIADTPEQKEGMAIPVTVKPRGKFQ